MVLGLRTLNRNRATCVSSSVTRDETKFHPKLEGQSRQLCRNSIKRNGRPLLLILGLTTNLFVRKLQELSSFASNFINSIIIHVKFPITLDDQSICAQAE